MKLRSIVRMGNCLIKVKLGDYYEHVQFHSEADRDSHINKIRQIAQDFSGSAFGLTKMETDSSFIVLTDNYHFTTNPSKFLDEILELNYVKRIEVIKKC